MVAPMKRIQNFLFNISWLSEITGNSISAVLYLLRMKICKSTVATGRCGENRFYFRKPDLSGVHEILISQEYNFLAPVLTSRKDSVILDCGAHIGLPVLWALTVNPDIKVWSVEASPDTFDILTRNKNNTKANWTIFNRACWSDESEISFSTRGDSMSHRAAKDGTLKVKGITFRELIETAAKDRNIDIMKVDIEGAEEEFLCAFEAGFEKVDRLVIELHPQLCNTQRVEEMIRRHFPLVEEIQGRTSSKPLLYCRK